MINEINKKLENLSKRCDILEKENIDYKKKLQLNQDNILNLLMQLKVLRKEYNKEIKKLKDNFNKEFDNIYQMFPKDENEIIINNEKNDSFDKKIKKEIENMVKKQLEDFKYEIYLYVGINASKEKKEKKIKKEKKEELIKYKNENLIKIFENKLFDIFNDKSQEIQNDNLNELKKLGTAIYIKFKQSPLNLSDEFISKTFNINIDKEKNGIFSMNYDIKKGNILYAMGGIMQKMLDENPEKFVEDFREKYGIDKNEISDKEILKIKNKFDNDEKKIIEAILKKLKFIK